MLGPSHRVANRRSFVRAGGGCECLGDFKKYALRNAAKALDHFRRVAGKMTLQDLEYATRMFKSGIGFKHRVILRLTATVFTVSASSLGMTGGVAIPGLFDRSALVEPARWVILLFLGVPSGE